ncbi:MAG: hypothetical protein JRF60_03645 [Deltaproteobacteria bacterium]|nr:hypothetical protein [Deltaproteobacteria bacterium]MBW2563578.1 hypothetical protein [Deltaproteobacteria bacterium]
MDKAIAIEFVRIEIRYHLVDIHYFLLFLLSHKVRMVDASFFSIRRLYPTASALRMLLRLRLVRS